MNHHFSRRFCVFAVVFLHALTAYSESDFSPGPRSTKEADLLLKEASSAQNLRKPDQEARALERFRNRYPSDPRMVEASLRLLQVYDSIGKPWLLIQTSKATLHLKLTPD